MATIRPLIRVHHKLNCHTYKKHGTGRQWKKEGTRKETRKKERRRKTKKMRKKEMGQEREKERRGFKDPKYLWQLHLGTCYPHVSQSKLARVLQERWH